MKTILGKTAPFDGAAVIKHIVRQPAAAYYLSRRLFEFFVFPNPSAKTCSPSSPSTPVPGGRAGDAARPVQRPAFYSARAYRAQIKTPVDFVVGAVRALGVATDGFQLPGVTTRMGQALFNPPNVAGWPGGAQWINSTTWMERLNFANFLCTAREDGHTMAPPFAVIVERNGLNRPEAIVDHFGAVLLDGQMSAGMRTTLLEYLSAGDPKILPSRPGRRPGWRPAGGRSKDGGQDTNGAKAPPPPSRLGRSSRPSSTRRCAASSTCCSLRRSISSPDPRETSRAQTGAVDDNFDEQGPPGGPTLGPGPRSGPPGILRPAWPDEVEHQPTVFGLWNEPWTSGSIRGRASPTSPPGRQPPHDSARPAPVLDGQVGGAGVPAGPLRTGQRGRDPRPTSRPPAPLPRPPTPDRPGERGAAHRSARWLSSAGNGGSCPPRRLISRLISSIRPRRLVITSWSLRFRAPRTRRRTAPTWRTAARGASPGPRPNGRPAPRVSASPEHGSAQVDKMYGRHQDAPPEVLRPVPLQRRRPRGPRRLRRSHRLGGLAGAPGVEPGCLPRPRPAVQGAQRGVRSGPPNPSPR